MFINVIPKIVQNKVKDKEDIEGDNNKELKRLQFYGAGPKMAGYNLDKKDDKPRGKIVNYDLDYDPVRIAFNIFVL